jgi:hypothetical protein
MTSDPPSAAGGADDFDAGAPELFADRAPIRPTRHRSHTESSLGRTGLPHAYGPRRHRNESQLVHGRAVSRANDPRFSPADPFPADNLLLGLPGNGLKTDGEQLIGVGG